MEYYLTYHHKLKTWISILCCNLVTDFGKVRNYDISLNSISPCSIACTHNSRSTHRITYCTQIHAQHTQSHIVHKSIHSTQNSIHRLLFSTWRKRARDFTISHQSTWYLYDTSTITVVTVTKMGLFKFATLLLLYDGHFLTLVREPTAIN